MGQGDGEQILDVATDAEVRALWAESHRHVIERHDAPLVQGGQGRSDADMGAAERAVIYVAVGLFTLGAWVIILWAIGRLAS